MHLVTPDQGSGPRTVLLKEPLLDQVNGNVKAIISLDLYGDGEVVLSLPDPSWSEEDEERRQRLLNEKRVAPVGQVNGPNSHGNNGIAVGKAIQLDKAKPIVLEAGPPQGGGPTMDELYLAP